MPGSPPLRLAAQAASGEGGEVGGPALIVFDAELVEVIPGIDPGVVQVVELDPDRVIADRLDFEDADMGAFGDDDLLVRPMALDFGRRALDPQIFGREAELAAVVVFDIEALFGALQAEQGRPWAAIAYRDHANTAVLSRARTRPSGAGTAAR